MAKSIFILLTLISHLAISQGLKKIVKYYDKDSTVVKEVFYYNVKLKKVDSLYISYYHSGIKKSEGYYKNDQMVGTWNHYYENGNPKASGQYDKNKQNGLWKYYYENGALSMEGKMVEGKKDEYWKTYYENNVLKSEGNYNKGKQDGNWNYYAETGVKKGTANLNNGNGEYEEYHDNGNIKVNGYIKNGVSDSLWTYYYPDGVLKSEGYEKNGQKNGEWKSYYENGVVSETGSYKGGKPVGNWQYFHENGRISSEGVQKEGKKDGKWSYYYDTGELKGESDFAAGDGDFKEYYPSGKLKSKGKVKNGKNSGYWEYYYETGEKEGEADYDNGSGKYVGYYPDGTKKMEGNVNDGAKVGTWSLYDEQGVLTGKYINIQEKEAEEAADAEAEEPSLVPQKPKQNSTIKNAKTQKPAPAKRQRYTPNIYKSFIVGFNPTAVIITQLPIYIEYYIEKRKGFEIQYTSVRSPFFADHNSPAKDREYINGYTITFKNKFYKNPKVNRGMWYIAYDLRYINIDNSVYFLDTLQNMRTNALIRQKRGFEATAQFGDRFIKKLNKPGMTLDIFLGIGIGYTHTEKKYIPSDYYDSKFSSRIRDGFYLPLRLGFNVGYLF